MSSVEKTDRNWNNFESWQGEECYLYSSKIIGDGILDFYRQNT